MPKPPEFENSDRTVANAKIVKFEKIPKKVRIMLDVKNPNERLPVAFDERKSLKTGDNYYSIKNDRSKIDFPSKADQLSLRSISENNLEDKSHHGSWNNMSRRVSRAKARRSFASSQALSGFTSQLRNLNDQDQNSDVSSVVSIAPPPPSKWNFYGVQEVPRSDRSDLEEQKVPMGPSLIGKRSYTIVNGDWISYRMICMTVNVNFFEILKEGRPLSEK